MLLTVENNSNDGCVEVYCDRNGLALLRDRLDKLEKYGGHQHLMTPSWAGNELTEEIQGDQTKLVHHLLIVLIDEVSESEG